MVLNQMFGFSNFRVVKDKGILVAKSKVKNWTLNFVKMLTGLSATFFFSDLKNDCKQYFNL